ncbi:MULTISPECIES: peptidylprolyl isomerase [unclassified Sedimentibacter]|uniref:peptidylprolyl isomerase n=1 Tax=unclassified Sedimentibacter TaxID=2649220 RepID=UPI0027E09D13|nr:peptidylprolyl isomerase [Sedimentibacter sp. MB35-C1]WMJ76471.1 peptidylprolyl isomerase [Sedimentibacter sp. MB35-C1]
MNKLKQALALTLALTMVLSVTACKQESTDTVEEGIKAKVNDKVITQEEYDENLSVYKKMAENQYGADAWEQEISEGQTMGSYYESTLLDQLIMDLLLVEAAEKEGITISEEELKGELDNFKAYLDTDEQYQQFLENYGMTEEYLKESLKKEFLINHYLALKIENLQPTDEELQTLFNDLKMNIKIKASHILVNTEDEAKNVVERLNNGENFEDLATELSLDTVSAANGGDLDYFEYTDMVQPFSEAAFSMEIGEISEPVKSDFGYHIIKVNDKIVDDEITVETEKTALTEYYKSFKYEELLEKLKSEATITE